MAFDDTATRRARRRLLLRVSGSIVVLALLLVILPADQLWATLRALPAHVWPLAIGAYLCAHLLGVTKWRLLINAAGAGLGWRPALAAYYWGLFGNLFLPSIVGGDVVRAGVALRAARSRSGLLLGSVVDRLQDVLSLGLLAGLGALLSPRALDAQSARAFATPVIVLALLGVVGCLVLYRLPLRLAPFKWRRRMVPIRRALRATASQPRVLLLALASGLSLQASLVALNWWLGSALGIDVPLYVWLFVWPLAKIAALLPVTQGGIGVREAALATLFAPFGVTAVQAVAAGLVFEGVLITGGVVSGIVSLRLGRSLASPAVVRAPAGSVQQDAFPPPSRLPRTP